MLPPSFWEIAACPACKSALRDVASAARCDPCAIDYPIRGGIANLFRDERSRTVDPARLRLKSRAEAIRTILSGRRSDRGFLPSPHAFYILCPILAAAAIAGLDLAVVLLLLLCLADWVFFMARRGAILASYSRSTLRLQTASDYETVDELYRRSETSQPTMSDWVRAAQEASSGKGEAGRQARETAGFDDERYREILEQFRAISPAPRTTLDVGTSDGRGGHEFGIGAGGLYIGIDVSPQLLEKFQAKLPDHLPLLGSGDCLPIRDGAIDFLFATETLEHLPDPKAALAEFARVLSPGGRLVIQSPGAHRIRNLNPFHLLQLLLGFLWEPMLLKKVVHENTWHTGVTYHWDFSVRDYRKMIAGLPLAETAISSRGIFVPRSLLRGDPRLFRRKERILGRIPILRLLGEDLVLLAQKPASP